MSDNEKPKHLIILESIRKMECKCVLCAPEGEVSYIARCHRCKCLIQYDPKENGESESA